MSLKNGVLLLHGQSGVDSVHVSRIFPPSLWVSYNVVISPYRHSSVATTIIKILY